jgi:hypothetical protein
MAVVLTTAIIFVTSEHWSATGAWVLFDIPGSLLQEGNLFNILIALVFGFSSLNILALAAKGFDDRPSRLKPGEILAITAMVLSVCFLGWEMLHLFHVFPIHLGGY